MDHYCLMSRDASKIGFKIELVGTVNTISTKIQVFVHRKESGFLVLASKPLSLLTTLLWVETSWTCMLHCAISHSFICHPLLAVQVHSHNMWTPLRGGDGAHTSSCQWISSKDTMTVHIQRTEVWLIGKTTKQSRSRIYISELGLLGTHECLWKYHLHVTR